MITVRRKGAPAAAPVDPEFEALREKWWPQWCVWRSRNGAGELNWWCATRRGEAGKANTTEIQPTAQQLNAVLEQMASGAIAPLYVGYPE